MKCKYVLVNESSPMDAGEEFQFNTAVNDSDIADDSESDNVAWDGASEGEEEEDAKIGEV